MDNNRTPATKRTILGALLLLLGIFWLFSNFNLIPGFLPHLIFSWELILIIIGVVIFINSNFSSGLTLIIIGSVFLVHRYYDFEIWELWPVIFIFAGLNILFRSGRKKKDKRVHWEKGSAKEEKNQTTNTDNLDEVAIFGGIKRIVESDNFEGGKITATFGGVEIDLSRCKLAPGENEIYITAMFGGVTLFVPNDWKVIIKVLPIFGGFSDERRKSASSVCADDRTLVIKGTVIFGGGEIKTA